MRILYVVRLFSGLEAGLRERVWRPRGVPTVYRMVEALDRSAHDVRFVFTCKDLESDWGDAAEHTFAVRGLRRPVTVLAAGSRLPRAFGRARGYLRELLQVAPLRRLHRQVNPDIMYFDRVNIYQAALAARFTRTPVVWRVMGVPPAMHAVLGAGDPVARLTRWAYRSPFANVICSQDGSGGEAWMDRALAPATPRTMMINGADALPESELNLDIATRLPADKTKVLFVARLVDDKGCMAFMQGFLRALDSQPAGLHAVIAGDGPYAAPMCAAAAEKGALDRVTFLGQVPHDQIMALHRHCDIYVSLNPMGNLTNANLEALRCGACMIIPASQPDSGIDVATDQLVPADAAIRVRNADDADGLRAAILALHANPQDRIARSEAARNCARAIIPSWDERIDREIALLEELAGKSSNTRSLH